MLLLIVILAAVVILPLLLSGVIIVSIAWTHRPDLSVGDILREAIFEIENTMSRKIRKNRGTGRKETRK